jgi:uracil-DNA glycosylase family 4
MKLSDTQKYILDKMEIPRWEIKKEEIQDPLNALEKKASICTLCNLCKTRQKVVFGHGDPQAKLLFIGEAPGEQEDKQGKPFVGPAGKLLTAMCSAIRIDRESVYITNTVKCRPPSNRNPSPIERSTCEPYLTEQIRLINPSLIVLLGKVAAEAILGCTESMTQLRGKLFEYQSKKVMVTYHPAYLLRSPLEKRKAYEDFQQIQLYLKAL